MRKWIMTIILTMCGLVHAEDQFIYPHKQPLPESFKTYKHIDSVGSLYLAGTITPRTFKKKIETIDGLEDVIHVSFNTNQIDLIILYDPGPSGDPHYKITALRAGKNYVTTIYADRLFVSAEGVIYAEARTNQYFNLRRKYILTDSGFEATPQPFHLVDEECRLEADLSLTSEPCAQGQVIAVLPKGSKAHILLASPPNEQCLREDHVQEEQEGYHDPSSFLIKTSFGLVGWAQTRSGALGVSSGNPLSCIVYLGD